MHNDIEERYRKIIKIALFAAIILTIIAVALFNVTSCVARNTTYVDMTDMRLIQAEEIPSSAILSVDSGGFTSYKNANYAELNIPDDAPVAVIKTTFGTVKARLYPEYAPKTVEQFTELANSGYYDGSYLFRVNPKIYAALGSKNADGGDGDSYNQSLEEVPMETAASLWPFFGSLVTLETNVENSFWDILLNKIKRATGTNFIICGTVEFSEDMKTEMASLKMVDEVRDAFIERGGVPNYSQKVAVFGQIFEGFDVTDKLLKLDIDNGQNLRPLEEVKIISADVSEWKTVKAEVIAD